MAMELTQPVVVHHGDLEQNRLLGSEHHAGPHAHNHGAHTHVATAVPVLVGAVPVVQAYAVPQQAGVVKHKHGPLKPLLALFLLALAVTLIGLLAYQAHTLFGAALVGYGDNSTDSDGFLGTDDDDDHDHDRESMLSMGRQNDVNGQWFGNDGRVDRTPDGRLVDGQRFGPTYAYGWRDHVGFNGAGTGMFFFGLLFAVLQAVTALTMWVHLAYYMPYLRHSSVLAPLKVTAAVGFIAMGFACRHISLGASEDTSETHHRVTHAIEAFIIINWIFVMLALIFSMASATLCWDCENLEEHKITRRMTAGYTQFFLALILIGLLAAYFQFFTERYLDITSATEMLLVFAIMFAVLQAMSGIAMIQQCGFGAPGQMPETVHALLKVVIAFGLIAFGFACRSIYLTSHSYLGPSYPISGASAHLIAIQSFVIINFIVSVVLTYASSHGALNWDNFNTTMGKRCPGFIFGVLQLIFSIVLFGLLAGLLQGLTANERESTESINAAGKYMIWFGLLFAVLEFFAGCTMLESGIKKLAGLNPSSVSVTNKVALAIGALAFGFACRHINLFERIGREGARQPLVHAIESFIIINFFLTWLIDILCVRGRIEW